MLKAMRRQREQWRQDMLTVNELSSSLKETVEALRANGAFYEVALFQWYGYRNWPLMEA